MQNFSSFDINLFKSITCRDDSVAKFYLSKNSDVNAAISDYFSAKDDPTNHLPMEEPNIPLPNRFTNDHPPQSFSNSNKQTPVQQSSLQFQQPQNNHSSQPNFPISFSSNLPNQRNNDPGFFDSDLPNSFNNPIDPFFPPQNPFMNFPNNPFNSFPFRGNPAWANSFNPWSAPPGPSYFPSMPVNQPRNDIWKNNQPGPPVKMSFPEEDNYNEEEDEDFEEGDFNEEDEEDDFIESDAKREEKKAQDTSFEANDDLINFVAITECDQQTAKLYLARYTKLDVAIEQYFRREENGSLGIKEESNDFSSNLWNSSQPRANVGFINPPQFNKPNLLFNTPVTISEDKKEAFKLRGGKYENYVKKYNQQDSSNSQWPKYLGSIKVSCRLSDRVMIQSAKPHDEVTFRPRKIDFVAQTAQPKKKQKLIEIDEIPEEKQGKKTWQVKGKSLYVDVIYNNQKIGTVFCDYEEAFVFLLDRNYIMLEGCFLDPQNSSYFYTSLQMDIFLTEEVIKSPLSVISVPVGRSRKGKGKEKEKALKDDDEESQKTYQLLKLTKESFVKLFQILKIKVEIPTLVQLRQRIDPFQRIRREKNPKHHKHHRGYRKNYQIGPENPAQLIKEDFKEYYHQKTAKVQNKDLPMMKSKSAMFSDSNSGWNSFGPGKHEDEAILLDDNMEFEMSDMGDDGFGSQNSWGMRRFNSMRKGFGGGRRSQKENTEEKKVDQDLLNTENQLSNYFISTTPADTMLTELHDYQKQALSWMKYREECMTLKDLFEQQYEDQRLLSDMFQEMVLLDQSKLYFNPFNGEISQDFPLTKTCKGGILADEMGLGKTVMMISLLHSHKRGDKKKDVLDVVNEEDLLSTVKKSKKKNMEENLQIQETVKSKPKSKKRTLDDFFSYSQENSKNLGENEIVCEKENEGEVELKRVKLNSTASNAQIEEEKIDLTVKLRLSKKDTVEKSESKKTMEIVQKTKEKFAGTLIVVPLSVLSQWENEIYRHSEKGSLKVYQYYKSNRKNQDLNEYDVVLTTYGLVESEYSKAKESQLFDCNWFRVILDEAHSIKSRTTQTTKAANALKAEYRWCLTGTPLQNKLDDMFSLLQFLKVETWGEYFWWNTYINKFVSHEEATDLIRGILRPLILRRTKKSTYLDGRNILELPPKIVENVFVTLSEEEKSVYTCFFQRSRAQFNEMVDGGTLGYEYAHVFELLIRLRQVCDHAALVFKKDDLKDKGSLETAVYKFLEKRDREKTPLVNDKKKSKKDLEIEDEEKEESSFMQTEFIQKTIERLRLKELEPCCVCLEEITIPTITKCGHILCKDCSEQCLSATGKCPMCQTPIRPADVMKISLEDQEKCKELLDVNCANFKKSAKLEAVLEAVKDVAAKKEKVVIFSQFIGMLNLIERFLKEENVGYRRIDGSCTLKNRDNQIDEFKTKDDATAFLISLKAGAIGLNLTAASHVFLVDPWWNPAIEDQAIERVYRIGQKKTVYVKRFVCKKTIEERITQLNNDKKEMIARILQFNPEAQKKQNIENMRYVMQGFQDDHDDDDE